MHALQWARNREREGESQREISSQRDLALDLSQSPCLAHKALVRLIAALLRYSTLLWSELHIFRNLPVHWRWTVIETMTMMMQNMLWMAWSRLFGAVSECLGMGGVVNPGKKNRRRAGQTTVHGFGDLVAAFRYVQPAVHNWQWLIKLSSEEKTSGL